MAKLRPGEPLSAIQSRDWNRFVDVADWYERFVRLGKPTQIIPHAYTPTTMLVRNNTAGDRAAGSVVEIAGTDITTMRRDQMMFNGIVRSGVDPYCGVYLEDTPDGNFGRCVVAGAVIAPVNIVDADNTHARVEVGSTQLKGDFGGWARILYKPGGTGVKTCVLDLGRNEEIIRKAKASQSINQGSSGTVDIYIAGSARGQATAHYNWFSGAPTIANGADLLVQYSHAEDKWIVIPPGGSSAPLRWTQMVSASGQSTWYWWQYGAGSRDTDGTIEITTDGVYAFPRFGLGTYYNSVGTAFALTTTPTAYNDKCITFSQKAWYSLSVTLAWGLPPLTSSQFNSGYRDSADHNHTYTDNGVGMTTGDATIYYPSRDTRQAVTVVTEINGVECGRSSIQNFYTADQDPDRFISHSRYLQIDRSSSLTGLDIRFRRLAFSSSGTYYSATPYVINASVRLEQISDNL